MAAYGHPEFRQVLQKEVQQLGLQYLPLQQALERSSVALEEDIQVSLLGTGEHEHALEVRVAIYFTGIISGCSCADDPTTLETQPEYCELQLLIERDSGKVSIQLAP